MGESVGVSRTNPGPAPTLVHLEPAAVDSHVCEWLRLYNQCFTGPPWNEPRRGLDDYRQHIGDHLAHTDLDAWEGLDAVGELVGLAYGWPAPTSWPDDDFYRSLASGLGTVDTAWLREEATFEVVELMVSPFARRDGIGRALLRALCAHQPVSWLATHPESSAADFYLHLGWRRYGRFTATVGTPLEVYIASDSR